MYLKFDEVGKGERGEHSNLSLIYCNAVPADRIFRAALSRELSVPKRS